jgi:hypothetical protein
VIRALIRLLVPMAVVATMLAAPAASSQPTDAAQAADLSYFDPSNIISDAVFYDYWSMDGPAIQAFLNAKGAKCAAGEMPCIKNYTQDTAAMAGDALCGGYSAGTGESAATIITKVAVSCGISPRVLLVLLQKEQSLITRTTPTVSAYTNATGFGCPDTAPCNAAFSGFVSQVYFAARQFQNYRKNPQNFGKRVGKTSTISYYPATEKANNLNDSRCGNRQIYMSNAATAGLYNYTPYVPNQAALSAGYGTGDGCSSYGNRNFWNYFTDWFGSTQSTGGGAIMTKYQSLGAESGPLGSATTSFACGLAGGGCWQGFVAGRIYWSPATGANALMGDPGLRFLALGSENGVLGYPTSDNICGLPQGGCYQVFQNATLYSTATTGTRMIRGGIRAEFQSQGSEWGALGFPTTDEGCGLVQGGCYQQFQNGRIYWSPASGAHSVLGDQLTSYIAAGSETGALGYPTTDNICGLLQSGCYQLFNNGTLYSTPTTGTHVLRGGIRAEFQSQGSEWGALGFPTSEESWGLPGDGCYQQFQNGQVYWSPTTGAHAVTGPVLTYWLGQGGVASTAGYPLATATVSGQVIRQQFAGGQITYDAQTSTATFTPR